MGNAQISRRSSASTIGPSWTWRAGELVERAGELQAFQAAVDRAASGRHALVVLSGEAGIGKSTLLAAVPRLAGRRGLRVMSAVGAELDRDVPFAVVSSLLGPALATPAQAARLLTGQAALAASLFDGSLPLPGDSDALVRGLYWLVTALAGEAGGLVVTVDDVQWADRASVRFLLHLATGMDGLPLALVLARRAGEPAPGSDLLDRLAGLRSAWVLSPAPLSPPAVAGLVAAALPEAPDGVAAACARVTGGNPFLVRELIDALARGACPAGELSGAVVEQTMPAAVARGVPVRLAALPAAARQLAASLAVLGSGAPLELAAALAELPVERADAAADDLAAARVLAPGEPLRFLHPSWRRRCAKTCLLSPGPPRTAAPPSCCSPRVHPPRPRPRTSTSRRKAAQLLRRPAPRPRIRE